jgi:MoxR-like ATPase
VSDSCRDADRPLHTPIPASVDDLQAALASTHYIADRGLAVSAFLALTLGRPLFLEGEAGVGKTAVAAALADVLDGELIRLQCYEGLDVSHAVYEWDYQRQLLEIRLLEASHALQRPAGEAAPAAAVSRHIFSEAFLIKRPLLRALESAGRRPTVLLIDEVDRADEEFEGYLLELLSEFQITIPELGTIRAERPPFVVLTSNRTREVHDALKRRCLYLWIDYPDLEKELRILTDRLPGVSARLAGQVAAFVQELRRVELYKVPGVSETLDWAAALAALDQEQLEPAVIDETLGILLKYREDVEAVRGARAGEVLSRALAGGVRRSG